MKSSKTKSTNPVGRAVDEILPEYDFSRGRRNPYATRYQSGSTVVVLDPDVAAAFPTGREVNEALRVLARLAGKNKARRTA